MTGVGLESYLRRVRHRMWRAQTLAVVAHGAAVAGLLLAPVGLVHRFAAALPPWHALLLVALPMALMLARLARQPSPTLEAAAMAADRYLDTKDLLVSALDQAGRPREKRAGAATLVLARAEAAVRGASEPPMGAARLAPWQVVSVGCALVGILLLMEPGRVTSPRPLAPVAGARPGTAVPGAVAQARKLVLAQAIGGPARPLPGQIRALDAAGPPGVTQAGSGRSLAPGALTDRAPQRVDGELLPSAEDGREVGARSGAPLGADGPAAGAAPGRSGATAVAASGETGNVRERRLLDIHLDAQGHLAPGVGQHGGLAAAPRRFAPNGSVAPAASSVPLNTLSPRLRLYAGRYLAALGGPR